MSLIWLMHEHQCSQPTIYLLYCSKVFCNLKKRDQLPIRWCHAASRQLWVLIMMAWKKSFDNEIFINHLPPNATISVLCYSSSMPVAWDLSLSHHPALIHTTIPALIFSSQQQSSSRHARSLGGWDGQRKEGYPWWVGQPIGGPVGVNLVRRHC